MVCGVFLRCHWRVVMCDGVVFVGGALFGVLFMLCWRVFLCGSELLMCVSVCWCVVVVVVVWCGVCVVCVCLDCRSVVGVQ